MAQPTQQVQKGETASGLAQKYGGSAAFLKANPSFAAQAGETKSYQGLTGNIKVGQNYVVPGTEATATPTPTPTPSTPPAPGSSNYVEDTTKNLDTSGNTPAGTTVGTSDTARAALQAKEDAITAPTPFSAADTLNKLRNSQGVANDESALAQNQTEQAQIQNDLAQFKQTSGQGMNESGRLGAVSEKEANATYRMNQLNIEQNAITGRIATKNAYISQALQAGGQDYATSKTAYDDAYKKASDAITSFNDNLETQKKDAMTGFTTITNLLKDNNIDLSKISPALKTQIDSLSLQAGIPTGTFEALATAHPDAKILAPIETTNADGSKNVYFMTQDPKTGQPTLIKSMGLGGGSGGTASGGTYGDIAQEAINAGATPQQALDEAITVAQNRGITLTKAQQDGIYAAASKMKPAAANTTATPAPSSTEQTATPSTPVYGTGTFSKIDIDSRIAKLSQTFQGDKASIRAQLKQDGYPMEEINNKTGNIVDKAQQAGNKALNFFSKLFG